MDGVLTPTDAFEVYSATSYSKIPEVLPSTERTVPEDLDTGLAVYRSLLAMRSSAPAYPLPTLSV